MPRVLHINDYVTGGGAEIVLQQSVSLLRDAGWEVRTFTADHLPDPRRTVSRYLVNRIARRGLQAILREFEPNVIHVHNFYHVLSPGILEVLSRFKSASQARVVMTAHDYHLVCPNAGGCWYSGGRYHVFEVDRIRDWSYLLSRRWDVRGWLFSMLKLAQHVWHYRRHDWHDLFDVVLCPSRFVTNIMDKAGWRTKLLANPVQISRSDARRGSGRLRWIFLGRLDPEKGFSEFLRRMPSQFPGDLTIVGDGAERASCEAIVRQRGLSAQVSFLGRVPHPQVSALLASSHVAMVPSLVPETFSLATVEALACGANVLASARGAVPEILAETGVGFVYDPYDTESLRLGVDEIQRQFLAGTLNRHDISAWLAARSPSRYVAELVRIYTSNDGPSSP